jgi:DNA repair protein RecO (recombination protein O)
MECHEKEGGFRIQNSVLYAMQFIISTPVEKLFTFRLSESVENQLDYIVTSYRRRYMEHEFKSESFLHM